MNFMVQWNHEAYFFKTDNGLNIIVNDERYRDMVINLQFEGINVTAVWL